MMTKPHQARNQLLRKLFDSLFTGLVLFLCVQTIAQTSK
jgi:hypothetical protein